MKQVLDIIITNVFKAALLFNLSHQDSSNQPKSNNKNKKNNRGFICTTTTSRANVNPLFFFLQGHLLTTKHPVLKIMKGGSRTEASDKGLYTELLGTVSEVWRDDGTATARTQPRTRKKTKAGIIIIMSVVNVFFNLVLV